MTESASTVANARPAAAARKQRALAQSRYASIHLNDAVYVLMADWGVPRQAVIRVLDDIAIRLRVEAELQKRGTR